MRSYYAFLLLIFLTPSFLFSQEAGCIDCINENEVSKVNPSIYKEDVILSPLKAIIKECEVNIEMILNPSKSSHNGLTVKREVYYHSRPEQDVRLKDGDFLKGHFMIDSKGQSLVRVESEDDLNQTPKKSQLGRLQEYEKEKLTTRSFDDAESFARVLKSDEAHKTPSVSRINSEGIYGRNLSRRLPSKGNPTRDNRDFMGDAFMVPTGKTLGRAYEDAERDDVSLLPGVTKIIKRIEKDDVVETLPKEQRHYLYCR